MITTISIMLSISAIVLSSIAYINANMLEGDFEALRGLIETNSKIIIERLYKTKLDKNRQIVKKGKKNEKRQTAKKNLQRKNR